MSRPSEPILAWFRTTLQQRGMNVASLAEAVGEERRAVKKVLAGREPLTVDQLMSWTQALELKLEDLVAIPPELQAQAEAVDQAEPAAAPTLGVAQVDERLIIDPYGLQAEQAIRVGFAMGCDFSILADTQQLKDSGIPEGTLSRFPQRILIRLDAGYHRYNEPVYGERTLGLTLSFDAIYPCVFPWASVLQVTYHVEAPAPEDLPEAEPEPEDEPEARPTLRLVK